MLQRRCALGALALLVCAVGGARGELITYSITGVGSGQLGADAFTNAAFTVTATYETDEVSQPFPEVDRVVNRSTTLSVAGHTVTLTNQINTALNRGNARLGLGDLTRDRGLLFLSDAAFPTSSLASPPGVAITGPANTIALLGPTTGGELQLKGEAGSPLTFSLAPPASVATLPEPTCLTMLTAAALTGTGYLGARRRRRRLVAGE